MARRRTWLALALLSCGAAAMALAACGTDSPNPAAQPRATFEPILEPTIFAVIEVTPVPPELVEAYEGHGDRKPIPPALDTRFVIIEPRIEVVQASWRQYLAGTRISTADEEIEWVMCSNGTGRFTDASRFGDSGRWIVLNPPRSLDWHEALVGTYPNEEVTVLAILSMLEGVPHITLTQWDQAPQRGSRPADAEPLPLGVASLEDGDLACAPRR